MNRIWQMGFGLACLWQAALAQAQLPITLEDIFLKQNAKELAISIGYANQQSDSASFLGFDSVVENEDRLTLDMSARFGASANTELSFDASTAHVDNRTISEFTGRHSHAAWQGPRLGMGFSYQLSQDTETPGLSVFGRVTLMERSAALDGDHVYGKDLSLGCVLYRTIDPVLLSVAASITYARARSYKGEAPGEAVAVDAGYGVSLGPRLSFFVNSKVTLAAGFSVQWADKVRRNGRAVGINETRTAILYGLGYSVSDTLSLHMQANVAATRDSGSSLQLELVHRMQ